MRGRHYSKRVLVGWGKYGFKDESLSNIPPTFAGDLSSSPRLRLTGRLFPMRPQGDEIQLAFSARVCVAPSVRRLR